jgi:hypothetical protein
MTEEANTDGPRRRGRRPSGTTGTRTARRQQPGGPELVESLNQMIDQLIKENRELKRQIDRIATQGTTIATGSVERTLRGIQRRLERATVPTPRRRRGTATTGTRRRRRTQPDS